MFMIHRGIINDPKTQRFKTNHFLVSGGQESGSVWVKCSWLTVSQKVVAKLVVRVV